MLDTDYDCRITVLKYSNVKRDVDFKYEIMLSTGMLRKYGGENYPDLPINILTTLYMIDEYPASKVKVSRIAGLSFVSYLSRHGGWRADAEQVMNDEFLDTVGRKLETLTAPEATVTVYSVIVKASDIRRIIDGNTGEQGQGKSQEDTE